MKRLLIAGGSHSDIPLIQAAQSRGYHVITSGNRADDMGHRYSNEVHLADFSDREAMLSLARRMDIEALCSSSNDFSVITCAYIAEILGLPGFDDYQTTLTIHHKDRFKAVASQLGLPSPVARTFSAPDISPGDLAGLPYPLMVKPIDLTGGKGISRIDSADQLARAVERAFDISRAKRIVIETFFPGTLHSCSSIIRDRKVIFEFADDEFCFSSPYLVTTSTSPAAVDPSVLPALRAATEALAERLHLADGLLHCQFIVNGRDFQVLEYTRRCSGDFYPVPVRHSMGVDHADLILQPSLGITPSVPANIRQQGFFSRHCVMTDKEGEILGLEIDDEIRGNILETFTLLRPGEFIRNHLRDKAAVMILHYRSAAEMMEKTQRITSLIRLSMAADAGAEAQELSSLNLNRSVQ